MDDRSINRSFKEANVVLGDTSSLSEINVMKDHQAHKTGHLLGKYEAGGLVGPPHWPEGAGRLTPEERPLMGNHETSPSISSWQMRVR